MEEISHTQKEIKNKRKIISSPIPALIEANMEVGNDGWGKRPIPLNLEKMISATIKITALSNPIRAGIKNLCLLEIFSSQILEKPSLSENFKPNNPRPPYKMIITAPLTKAIMDLEAGRFCPGESVENDDCGKSTETAAEIANTITRIK